jgi:dUTP pyrophosphatase
MRVNVKLLKGGSMPVRASAGAAGWDLRASEDVIIEQQETAIVPTGFSVEFPSGYEMQIRSRSGLAARGIVVANSPGTVDADYRGEVKVILRNESDDRFRIRVGDRIAQAVFAKLPDIELVEADSLSDTERGHGGIGSTGVRDAHGGGK